MAFLTFIVAIILDVRAEQKEAAKAIAALAPGVYIRKSDIGNPFINECDYVRVYEIKDGWVRYARTRADRSDDASAMHSIKSESFVRIYVRHPFFD